MKTDQELFAEQTGQTALRDLVVRIPGRPPTPNDRRHWRLIARDNALWKAKAVAAIEEQLDLVGFDPMDRAELEVTFVVPTRARHDWDNLIASTKPLTDAFVATGILRDDSTEVVVDSVWRCRLEPGQAATVYRVRELPSTERLGL